MKLNKNACFLVKELSTCQIGLLIRLVTSLTYLWTMILCGSSFFHKQYRGIWTHGRHTTTISTNSIPNDCQQTTTRGAKKQFPAEKGWRHGTGNICPRTVPKCAPESGHRRSGGELGHVIWLAEVKTTVIWMMPENTVCLHHAMRCCYFIKKPFDLI